MELQLRVASEADASDIATLVNKAYRPSSDKAGWTHESHMLAGDRTNSAQLLALFEEGSTILLLCLHGKIVACVHVQGGTSGAYIGMLATDPALQAKGLGKQMLAHAEAYAVSRMGAEELKMSVLTGRPELLAFYQRRGYVLTGEVGEYPIEASVGVPVVEGIEVLSLAKPVVKPSLIG